MATEETSQPTEEDKKKPLFHLPKFTSERWADGIYDAEHREISASLYIREEHLLTYDQRVELETRALIFQYQQEYAKKEYELLKKEFQNIEKRLNQQEASEAEPAEHVFAKPAAPVQKKSGKKPKTGTSSRSSSEADEKGTSSDSATSDGTKASKDEKKSKKKNRTKKQDSEGEIDLSTDETRATRSRTAKNLGKK